MPVNNSMNTVVAGHICLDIIPNMDSLPVGEFLTLFQPGRLVEVGAPYFSTGGPVSNTGLALHILGIPTRLMGKVGDDSFGQAVINLVRRYGEDLVKGMVIDPTTSTSYTVIVNPPGVDRIFLHNPGANNTFGPEDIRLSDLDASALFHFGYPTLMRRMYENEGHDLAEIFKLARASGTTTSLDLSFPDPTSPSGKAPWSKILASTLAFVDIFTPSIEELLYTMQPALYEQLCQQAGSVQILPLVTPGLLHKISSQLLDLGVKVALIKLGERGAYLRTAHNMQGFGRAAPGDPEAWSGVELWAPCFQVDVAGTTGSGDATIAGFLSAFLRGLSPEDTLTAAVAVGACNVEAVDALGGLRGWQETIDRINSSWHKKPLLIEEQGWRWDNTKSLWRGSRS
jgi:sugar/nucleoside kinase (ribokinase family)